MRYAVIDTNVLVSALISPNGNAAIILGMITNGFLAPLYCSQIIYEYTSVLERQRFGFSKNLIDEALTSFDIFGVPVQPEKSDFFMVDESDRVFYDTAVSGNAMLITGNLRHYPQKTFIVNPANFLLLD